MGNLKRDWKKLCLATVIVGATFNGVSIAQTDTTGGTNGGSSTDVQTDTTTTTTTTTTTPPRKTGNPATDAPFDEMTTNPKSDMLLRTLMEEKAEIQQLAAQQAAFRKLGDRQNIRIANMLGRWIREHKAAGPKLVALIHHYGADPELAVVRKTPVVGSAMQMLQATHQDHMNAVINSQSRYFNAPNSDIRAFMHKRANLARKHMRQMTPYYHGSHTMR